MKSDWLKMDSSKKFSFVSIIHCGQRTNLSIGLSLLFLLTPTLDKFMVTPCVAFNASVIPISTDSYLSNDTNTDDQQKVLSQKNTALTIAGLEFHCPIEWQPVPISSSMRVAQFAVPPKPSENTHERGEVVFFHFHPGDGGTVEANVRRWIGQFQESPEESDARTATEDITGIKVTFVAAQGTYNSGMPGGPTTPKPNFALRGAILETPQGNVFVRFTGPRILVEENEELFTDMIRKAAASGSRT